MVDGIVQYFRQWEEVQCVPVHHPQTSPASRDEQYPLLCSLTCPRHWKCLRAPRYAEPAWKFQAHLLKAQFLHVALRRPENEQII